jgi:hypothetical protein
MGQKRPSKDDLDAESRSQALIRGFALGRLPQTRSFQGREPRQGEVVTARGRLTVSAG